MAVTAGRWCVVVDQGQTEDVLDYGCPEYRLRKTGRPAFVHGMHARHPARFLLATALAAGGALWMGVRAAVPAGAVPLQLTGAPALSPDGMSMVFEWSGDLWTAASDGGEAKRVVDDPAHDDFPRFTPDGTRIVFTSERTGSPQVFSIPAIGGQAIQHTRHTEGCTLECLAPDGSRALVRGPREDPSSRATRLLEIDLTHECRERRLFDGAAQSAAWSPDGTRVLFCRGGEAPYRKGYHGSRASQIWLYQPSAGSFECLVADGFEALSPRWLPDGTGYYHVSNRGGTANLWLRKNHDPPRQITVYQGDGVITPDLSADGSTLVFRRGLGICRFRPESDPAPLDIELWTREPLADVSRQTQQIGGTPSADFTRDPQQVVFAAADDLWWIDRPGASPALLTETTAAEDEVRFSPDGQWLYFRRDDGIEANYFRARFANGSLRDEAPVTRGTRSKCRFMPSPEGSRIAWVEGVGDVFTADADGTSPRRVFHGWDKPAFDWSPDGRWLAIAAEDREACRNIVLAAADGRREAVDLTRQPGGADCPRWSPDGRWLVFTACRDGTRTPRLWRIDFGKGGPATDPTSDAALLLGDRARMLDSGGIEPIRLIWAADSQSLWFQSASAPAHRLYSIGVAGDGMRTVVERRGMPIRATPDGSLLWRVEQTPEILRPGGEVTRFPISMAVTRPREVVLTRGFRRIWRTLGEGFHDAALNGCDWQAIRLKYEAAAGSARNPRQFGRVIDQLCGELNASHLAFKPLAWPAEIPLVRSVPATAHPGWVFRDTDSRVDAPLVIARMIPGSPAALLTDPPAAGDSVVRIAGEPVSNGSALERFFNGAANRPLPVVLRGPDGGERVIELRCISYQNARRLERLGRQAAIRARVAEALPAATYLAVPGMDPDTVADLERQIYRASFVAGGMILDLRDNGGGREADRLLACFSQTGHAFTVPRDGPAGYPIDRRPGPAWHKPLVVLCNHNTFSNAEIFCHAIQQSRRAPLVGTATAGGVITARETDIPDAGSLCVPFRAWFHATTGENLELNGAQPDIVVDLTPADEDAGRDPQLAQALETLRRNMANAAPAVRPRAGPPPHDP